MTRFTCFSASLLKCEMDIDQLEAEAQRLALQQVANMLQRPDQLEKVDQYKQRYVCLPVSYLAVTESA